MAAYDTGYEDERFQHPVGQTLHCGVCMNVLKDPVMCRRNEHLYCRGCITPHLLNSQTCPTCMDPLTVETLSQAPRGIRSLLAELKIRCEFYDRGCREFIELGDLERHLGDCGFGPAVCSNEGCRLEVNRRDLLHHETAVCELRRVQCHSCNDIKQEIDTVKVSLAAMDEKLGRLGTKLEENVIAEVELIQEQLNKQDESNLRLEAEMKKCFNEITKLGMVVKNLYEVQTERMRKGIAEAGGMDKEPKVVVIGGKSKNNEMLKSVEMLNVSNKTWIRLQQMNLARMGASVFVDKDQVVVNGGSVSGVVTKVIETLSLNALQGNQSLTWKKSGSLPCELWGHCSLVYTGRVIVIGGNDGENTISDRIVEISLVPPYAGQLLATMEPARWLHGLAIFDDKIVIVGGAQGLLNEAILKTVLLYDLSKNECQDLAPLPYAVCEVATVKWGEDNIIILGGLDCDNEVLNKVLLYNIKSQKSHELRDMKYRRRGCVAALLRDTVLVMGGKDEGGNILKSVESFRFDRYSWQELPEMHEERYLAAAVVW